MSATAAAAPMGPEASTSITNGQTNGQAPARDTTMADDVDEGPIEVAGRPVDLIANDGEQVEIDLDDIALEGRNVALTLLLQIQARSQSWTTIAQEHFRKGRLDMAVETLRVAGQELERRGDLAGALDVYAMQGHISLLQARSAPKLILREPRQDKLPPNTLRARDHFQAAGQVFQRADEIVRRLETTPQLKSPKYAGAPEALLLGKAMLFTSVRNFPEAEKQLGLLLRTHPNNLPGLISQARVFLQTKRPDLALKNYQKVLQLEPEYSPDPRVGLGLAYWLAGDLGRARHAWRRALKRDAGCVGAAFLLSLGDVNEARDPATKMNSRQRQEAHVNGTKTMAKLFGASQQRLAPVALSLVRNTELQGQIDRAIKLAERAIQYADTVAHTRRGVSERTRLAYAAGDLRDVEEYTKMARADPIPDPVVEILSAQAAVKAGSYRQALEIIENAAKRLGPNAPLEINLCYALLLAYRHPGMTPVEWATNEKVARDLLTQIHELLKSARAKKNPLELEHTLRGISQDALIFVQLAKLWERDNLDKAIDAYRTAIEIRSKQGGSRDLLGIKMSNNLATLYMMQGNHEAATQLYEQVITTLGEVKEEDEKSLQVTLLYNLGRAYEETEDYARALEAYRGLLAKHPEYYNAKLRIAQVYGEIGRFADARGLMREAEGTNDHDPVVRATIVAHLASQDRWEEANRYSATTRKMAPDDVHALVTLAASYYRLARESKGGQTDEKRKNYLRAAELYEKALMIDPSCTTAIQGLAIAIAEDNLPTKTSEDTHAGRVKAFDIALSIFNRIKDSMPSNANVLSNVAHCHSGRGEDEKAVEAYAAASALQKHQDVPTLLYLSRSYYQLASKTENYSAMLKALSYCQKALHLKPTDKAILYNVAMIQQKAAELVLGLDPSKRTVLEVRQVIAQAEHSTKLFHTLAEMPDKTLPYDADIADQRSKYGENLLRRAAEQEREQIEYEAEQTEKHAEARRKRAEERARLAEIEHKQREEARLRAQQEAELRAQQQEEAQEWRERMKREQEEEDARVRVRKERKEVDVIASGDEGMEGAAAAAKKPKRSRKKKAKREEDEDDDMGAEEPLAELTDEDEDESAVSRSRSKPRKKKRPAAADPDEEDEVAVDRPSKKSKFKSAAVIDDSDDEI